MVLTFPSHSFRTTRLRFWLPVHRPSAFTAHHLKSYGGQSSSPAVRSAPAAAGDLQLLRTDRGLLYLDEAKTRLRHLCWFRHLVLAGAYPIGRCLYLRVGLPEHHQRMTRHWSFFRGFKPGGAGSSGYHFLRLPRNFHPDEGDLGAVPLTEKCAAFSRRENKDTRCRHLHIGRVLGVDRHRGDVLAVTSWGRDGEGAAGGRSGGAFATGAAERMEAVMKICGKTEGTLRDVYENPVNRII